MEIGENHSQFKKKVLVSRLETKMDKELEEKEDKVVVEVMIRKSQLKQKWY